MKSQGRAAAAVGVLLVLSLAGGVTLAITGVDDDKTSSASSSVSSPSAAPAPSSSPVVADVSGIDLADLFLTPPSIWTLQPEVAGKSGQLLPAQIQKGVTATDGFLRIYTDATGRTLSVALLRVSSDADGQSAVGTFLTGVPGAGAPHVSSGQASMAVDGMDSTRMYAAGGFVESGVVALVLITSTKAITDTELNTLVGSQDATIAFS